LAVETASQASVLDTDDDAAASAAAAARLLACRVETDATDESALLCAGRLISEEEQRGDSVTHTAHRAESAPLFFVFFGFLFLSLQSTGSGLVVSVCAIIRHIVQTSVPLLHLHLARRPVKFTAERFAGLE
jgi:hypothetical protein